MKSNGVTAADLKAAGFHAAALRTAGFDAADLYNNSQGFTIEDLEKAGFDSTEFKKLVFKQIDEIGIDALLSIRFKMSQLKDKFGFTAVELKDMGFDAPQLKDAFPIAELKTAGFDAAALKTAGIDAADLYDGSKGFTIEDLEKAGFDATELKQVIKGLDKAKIGNIVAASTSDTINLFKNKFGFTATEMKDMGFEANILKQGGFTDQELKGAFTDDEPTTAGIGVSLLVPTGNSGGRGPSAARKIHMTRRTRLRLKKSRVITRRPKSSHLHHVSNASVGSTRKKLKGKKQITNGSGKAISTRKI